MVKILFLSVEHEGIYLDQLYKSRIEHRSAEAVRFVQRQQPIHNAMQRTRRAHNRRSRLSHVSTNVIMHFASLMAHIASGLLVHLTGIMMRSANTNNRRSRRVPNVVLLPNLIPCSAPSHSHSVERVQRSRRITERAGLPAHYNTRTSHIITPRNARRRGRISGRTDGLVRADASNRVNGMAAPESYSNNALRPSTSTLSRSVVSTNSTDSTSSQATNSQPMNNSANQSNADGNSIVNVRNTRNVSSPPLSSTSGTSDMAGLARNNTSRKHSISDEDHSDKTFKHPKRPRYSSSISTPHNPILPFEILENSREDGGQAYASHNFTQPSKTVSTLRAASTSNVTYSIANAVTTTHVSQSYRNINYIAPLLNHSSPMFNYANHANTATATITTNTVTIARPDTMRPGGDATRPGRDNTSIISLDRTSVRVRASVNMRPTGHDAATADSDRHSSVIHTRPSVIVFRPRPTVYVMPAAVPRRHNNSAVTHNPTGRETNMSSRVSVVTNSQNSIYVPGYPMYVNTACGTAGSPTPGGNAGRSTKKRTISPSGDASSSHSRD